MFFALFLDAKESVFNVAVLASEDGVTVLEEVIMSAFQQCVYHMTKVQEMTASAFQQYMYHLTRL